MFTVVAGTEPVEEIVTVFEGGFETAVDRFVYETDAFSYDLSEYARFAGEDETGCSLMMKEEDVGLCTESGYNEPDGDAETGCVIEKEEKMVRSKIRKTTTD